MSDIAHTSLHTPAHTEQGWVIAAPLAHPAAAKVRVQAKAQVYGDSLLKVTHTAVYVSSFTRLR